MMAGVPSISSDIPYAREVLVENDLGAFFKPGDPQDLARVISELLADGKRLETLRQNCISKAHVFSWEREVEKLLREYARLTNGLA
jgi:glycosyltransferase involved in cell wall biosynthesis